MATRLKIAVEGQSLVHFDGVTTDHTLCGLTLGGDSHLNISIEKIVTLKVNCHDCLKIVRYCKSIKESEFKKQ